MNQKRHYTKILAPDLSDAEEKALFYIVNSANNQYKYTHEAKVAPYAQYKIDQNEYKKTKKQSKPSKYMYSANDAS